MDYSKFSDADLDALSKEDYDSMSTEGLQIVVAAEEQVQTASKEPSIPTHTPNALDAEVAGFKDTNLANQEKADQEQARIDKLPPSTPRQTFLSSPLNKTLKGWSDPVTGSAQLAPRILEKLTSAGGFFLIQ